jgi:hypothetical protein
MEAMVHFDDEPEHNARSDSRRGRAMRGVVVVAAGDGRRDHPPTLGDIEVRTSHAREHRTISWTVGEAREGLIGY